MNSRFWHLLQSGPGDHAINMAVDEALLEAMHRLGRPALRFYSWTEPAASFGYFQRHAEVERLTPLRPLVRRPTAGGIVPHNADWTYSLAFPVGDEWYSLVAKESYRRLHEWVQEAFAKLGLAVELAPESRKEAVGSCFVGHERFDLLWQGRKIAGAAQRRRRDGLLMQGSIQPPPSLSLNRTAWQNALCDAARSLYGVRWSDYRPDASLTGRALDLARQKYSRPEYNRKR
jgi:lipoate-protein ligase A